MVNHNKLFTLTRWRLASWYAGVIGIILSLCRLGIYEAIAHVHKITLNLELKSVVRTLHDSLELTLKQPRQLEPATSRFLPNLCLVPSCLTQLVNSELLTLQAIHNGDYYLRLVDSDTW